jgi:hypothetical protein
MKTYADVLLLSNLGKNITIISGNASIVVAILNIFKQDIVFANFLSNTIGISFAVAYWLVYLTILVVALTVNMVLLFLETRNCLSAPDDWSRVESFIFQERPNYNFSTGQHEMTKDPLYLLFFFGLLFAVVFWMAIDMMVLSPLNIITTKDHFDYVFQYSLRTFYGTFFLSQISPLLFLLLRILFSHTVFIIKQWINS